MANKFVTEIKGWFGKDVDKTDDNAQNQYFRLLFPNNSTPTVWGFGEQQNREKFAKYITDPNKANGVVYSIVNSIASTAAELFGYVELLDEKNDVVDAHPALDRLRNPNDIDTLTTFIEQVVYNLLTTGDAFIYGEWNGVSNTRSPMYVIPSASIEIVTGGLVQPIKGYKLSGSMVGNNPTLTPENTMFIKLPNINNETFYGLSPLAPILKDLDTLDLAKRLENKLLKEGGVKSLICLTEFPDGENQQAFLDLIRAQLNDKNAKTNEVFPIPLNRIPLGDTSVDMALQDIIKGKTEIICQAYGYPTNLLYSESTYSNLSEAKRQKYVITIPYVNLIAEGLSKFFKLDEQGLGLKLNTDQIEELKPDYRAVVDSMRDFATINEVREYLKLPPVKDGDVLLIALGKVPLEDVIEGRDVQETEPKK